MTESLTGIIMSALPMAIPFQVVNKLRLLQKLPQNGDGISMVQLALRNWFLLNAP